MTRRWLLPAALLVACAPVTPDADPTTPPPPPATAEATAPGPGAPEPTAATTSTTASPPREVPEGMVGYVGCSVIVNAAEGYHLVGGAEMWPGRGVPFGGGTIGRWALEIGRADTQYWSGFERLLDEQPPASIWWGLCTGKTGRGDRLEVALDVLAEIERIAPGLPVFVSAQPGYAEGHVCDISGEDGPETMAALVDRLVSEGHTLAGPRLGPLAAEQTVDGCHANEAGKRLLGEQLVAFFGP